VTTLALRTQSVSAIFCSPIFSEREREFTLAICYRPSVCLSSCL